MKYIFIYAFLIIFQDSFSQDSSIVFNSKRQIKLEGGSNFRDLGGYPTTDGKFVKWGKIYRSADISKLTDNDLMTLKNIKLSTVCDLRGPDELQKGPDKLPEGVRYINLPAGSEQVSTNNNYATMNRDSMMISFYGRTDHLKAKYKPMFDEILALNNEQALMFHCTAGKDRTGIGAALVLSALGVEKSYILADYEATNIFWKDTREKMIQGMLKSGMSEIAAKNMLAANPAYIRFFLDAIDKKFGSMEQFLNTEMELTSVKRKILSEKFLTIK